VGTNHGADPSRVVDRADFGQELTLLRQQAGLTVRALAARVGLPSATAGGYFGARHLPSPNRVATLCALLAGCGVTGPEDVEAWLDALARARRVSDGRLHRGR
jgi:transcriptional regulator with XRE-family HTH domain